MRAGGSTARDQPPSIWAVPRYTQLDFAFIDTSMPLGRESTMTLWSGVKARGVVPIVRIRVRSGARLRSIDAGAEDICPYVETPTQIRDRSAAVKYLVVKVEAG